LHICRYEVDSFAILALITISRISKFKLLSRFLRGSIPGHTHYLSNQTASSRGGKNILPPSTGRRIQHHKGGCYESNRPEVVCRNELVVHALPVQSGGVCSMLRSMRSRLFLWPGPYLRQREMQHLWLQLRWWMSKRSSQQGRMYQQLYK
jgi:hypothetical protein